MKLKNAIAEYERLNGIKPDVINRYSITLREIKEIKDAGETIRAMMGNMEKEPDAGSERHVKWINRMLKRNGFEVIE